ncbi:Na/Pi cotransporter family protein [Lutispora thermophila]|uniref:Phosphate:Na+ symporter n=1 Tax=Lutispora thermophila DSM 19022 TaxID=1122184 RepID=A0A1M6B4U5_9FIRM|nr:Na/Pi cotransporter family protein [Lutispora thermophila]SHI43483.1 phosphate:Na+ symporter [Lutispora thermophila DSM 19022]
MRDLIFGLIGGTALLMYGVDKMGEGLEKASGEMMKKMLSILTGKVWSAFLVGTIITALVQSSTAVTVLTVGFVNAGLMKLPQAVGIIYGANIGTTITAQLMAFSFNFKLTEIALPVLGIGFAIGYFSKNKTLKNFGDALMGFGMMFLGLKILNQGIPFMQHNPTLRYFFETYASIPIVGILLGAVATALVHSSAATVGLVMILGQASLLDLTSAVTIMLGDNIGTCISAQLASFSGNIHARRTAWAHTLYNVFGVILVSLILPYFVRAIEVITLYFQPNGDIGSQIANSHTFFNVFSASIFLPLTKYYVKFLETVIRGKELDHEPQSIYLDKLLMDTPAAAFKATISEITRGAELTRVMLNNVMEALFENDKDKIELVNKDEEVVNQLQKDITVYMVELSKRPLSDANSIIVHAMITSINNIERMGDHISDIAKLVESKINRNLVFSDEAIDELKQLKELIIWMYDNIINLLKEKNEELAKSTAELEDKVDELCKELANNHIIRLEAGKCNVEAGVIYLDIINHFERIADHIYKVSLLSKDELQGIARSTDKNAVEA